MQPQRAPRTAQNNDGDILTQLIAAATSEDSVAIIEQHVAELSPERAVAALSRILGQTLGIARLNARVDDGEVEPGAPVLEVDARSMALVLDLLDGAPTIWEKHLEQLGQLDRVKVAVRSAAHLAALARAFRSLTGSETVEAGFRDRMRFGIEASAGLSSTPGPEDNR